MAAAMFMALVGGLFTAGALAGEAQPAQPAEEKTPPDR